MRVKEKHLIIILVLYSFILTLILGLSSHPYDFMVYYHAGQSLLSGRVDLYAPDFALSQLMDYRYPPFFLLVLAPLWMLPYQIAATVWYILDLGALIGCVMVLRRATETTDRQLAIWLIAFLIVEQYVVETLRAANAHPLVVCLMFAALWLGLRKKTLTAAFLFALAITIKPFPLMLAPYFLIRKQWRFLSMMIVFLVVLNTAPAAYFGYNQNTQLLRTWFNKVAIDPDDFHQLTGPLNLSLKAQLRRYLTDVDYSGRTDEYPAINVLSLSPKLSDILWGVLSVGLLLITIGLLWWGRRYHSENPEDENAVGSRTLLEQGLFICLMLMISPSTIKIYCIALMWPAVALAGFAFNNQGRAALLSRCVLLLAAGMNFILPLLPGRSVQRFLNAIGADFYVICLLMIGLFCALASSKHTGLFKFLCGRINPRRPTQS